MKHDNETHLLSGAYALDALTPGEIVAMEAAMQSSEDLRGEVAELTDTAVLLGLSVESVAPPAGMRDRLLAIVAQTPQLEPADEHASVVDETESAPAGVVVRGPQHWFQRPAALIGAAAAAMVIFVGGSFAGQIVQETSNTAREASSFVSLVSASDVHRAQTSATDGGTAMVVWSPSQHSAAVVLNGVETVPAGKVLQLWHVDGNTVTSAGLFTPTAGQRFEMLSGSVKNGEKVGVTVEPAGGSKQPTSAPIAMISVSA